MQKWEYLVVIPGNDNYPTATVHQRNGQDVTGQKIPFFQYINQLGEDSWELVANAESRYVFKHPKP